MPIGCSADLRRRLEDVHEELHTIDGDLPEPLTHRPMLANLECTVALCQRLEKQDSGEEYVNL